MAVSNETVIYDDVVLIVPSNSIHQTLGTEKKIFGTKKMHQGKVLHFETTSAKCLSVVKYFVAMIRGWGNQDFIKCEMRKGRN